MTALDVRQLDDLFVKISEITDVVARNTFKIAFVGRTSNGKSTVINALLSNKILPTGLGHTTNCFFDVTGVNDIEGWVSAERNLNEFRQKDVRQSKDNKKITKKDVDKNLKVCYFLLCYFHRLTAA